MKRILILLALLPVLALSQTIKKTTIAHGLDQELYFYAASCDSGSTTSETLDLSSYNNDLATYPISYYLYVAENSSSYNPILAVYLEGKNNIGTWVTVDTLYASDTVTTNITAKGVLDLNTAALGIYPTYRLKAVATSGLGKTFALKASILLYKKD
jgi:hypothetical protein